MRRVAVIGGIGSGKSVVSRMLRAMGYPVYDSDTEARRIMDASPDMHERLVAEIHPRAVMDGVIDRPLISSVVFSNPQKLKVLNGIVHSAVKADLEAWFEAKAREVATRGEPRAAFVETALLYESGLDSMVDEVWKVEAPEELRISRVMVRNGVSAENVKCRVAAQIREERGGHDCTFVVRNDEVEALLPQIEERLKLIPSEK